MQYNQPFWCTGYQNTAQFHPQQTHSQYPEVVGEGDVMSLMLPDGSLQYYFMPINRRDGRSPYPPVSNTMSFWPNANNEAWFVRSILNTHPAPGMNQQISNEASFPTSYANNSLPIQNYVQKFHNDSWTSTTDLIYFYPQLRYDWRTKGCTAVQVELPKDERTIYHYGTICNRPCNCASPIDAKTAVTHNANCCTETPMSVDDTKPDSAQCCSVEFKNLGENNINNASSNKTKHHSCGCDSLSNVCTSDKPITTCADQASSAIDIKGREKHHKKTKKNNVRSSNREADACHSACCLGSRCSQIDQCYD